MHITPAVVAALEQRWGVPAQVELSFPMHEEEWRLVARTAARGRIHDVTMFTLQRDSVAVIRKPSYWQGIWRAPSGGVAPGETVEAGAVRECWEETGLRTEVQRYLLRVTVVFSRGVETMIWQSHVMQMRYLSGTPCPVDTHEVAEARWATLEELDGPIRAAMLATGSGGLAYRAELQALVSPLLKQKE